MDNMLYIAMSGAKQNMNSIAVRANNLANVKTTGFKADFEQARAMQAFGEGLPTRVFSMTERPGQNLDSGAIITTDRDLDVAIEGDGWIAVQAPDGSEAYTRQGNLRITDTGTLETANGMMVMGEGGPIVLPVPLEKLEIGKDGTISVLPQGAPGNAVEDVDRIKLVKPELRSMYKADDGLFRRHDGQENDADGRVSIISGALETSNVNAVGEMTHMISLQRQFELQVKMMKTAETNDQQHNQIMRVV
jgi:flagellar basal-body rod protein FlgF